ncbi:hypothetical protein P153DRAFT_354686 [Dothidotthia symphoricarpi CBS 119687]|uniref:Zn(2)-C6 fungal-type domain-containing protein n=1 Tax=Dothidotthia symphoricarpi CBS 119687 TaxID=1392245 RepID=A0A6A6ALG3_9PLEO|nr:uncharacterized protein P153DRAFT_354686 [Dothidotthia symphoricarpi CBS 119687]KAF2132033.1 hypothetical protein P153DRAFT_354686 [Dothidotthia symphoricarpi CBS 119687]
MVLFVQLSPQLLKAKLQLQVSTIARRSSRVTYGTFSDVGNASEIGKHLPDMPKQRQTCTRCSQRRQKCDRKSPCTRCILNDERDLCTTKWVHGYNPSVHRKYPRRQDLEGQDQSPQSAASSRETSSSLGPPLQNAQPTIQHWPLLPSGTQNLPSHVLPQSATSAPGRGPPQAFTPSSVEEFSVGGEKPLDIGIGAILSEKDSPAQDTGLSYQDPRYMQTKRIPINAPGGFSTCYSSAAAVVEIQYLQSILPSKENVIRITNYYEQCMLYWINGIYHGPSFRRELNEAYDSSDQLNLSSLDWRWTALLFAILSSGIIGCPEDVSDEWGFPGDDKVKRAREWGGATVACLNLGNYTSQYHIHSVHAIYILHAYEHLAGSTNQWIALRSVASIIAKGLGLHRLGPHPDDEQTSGLSPEQKQALIDREIGRRTWYTITTQDWLITVSQGTHNTAIQKNHFTTSRPRLFDDKTMTLTSDSTPALAHIGNFFFDNASGLLNFFTAMSDVQDEDDATRYGVVVKYDGDFRADNLENMPICLSHRTPINPAWPCWTKWARRMYQSAYNHNIIMIHQTFLSKSFKEPRYTYSRWASTNAAKIIIGLYTTREPDEPQLWVEQAFVVTAGICLGIDLFHRSDRDSETQEYYACVHKAIDYLGLFPTSSVATHGRRLLTSLIQKYMKIIEEARSNSQTIHDRSFPDMSSAPPDMSLAGVAGMASTLPSNLDVHPANDETVPFHLDTNMLDFDFEDIMCGIQDSMDYNPFLDSMLSMATGQLP